MGQVHAIDGWPGVLLPGSALYTGPLMGKAVVIRALIHSLLVAAWGASLLWPQPRADTAIPKTWDEMALADWATPLAGLNVRPTHISSQEYYSMRVDNLRTYPVYLPGREPEGYWEMLQHVGPQPLIEPEKLKTQADWTAAGQRVFDEADMIHERVFDPKIIESARRAETFRESGTEPLPDGTLYFLRWVPTNRGVALSLGNCNSCHLQFLKDGTRVPGAPSFPSAIREPRLRNPLVPAIHNASGVFSGDMPFQMTLGDPVGDRLYQTFGVPWIHDEQDARLKSFTTADYLAYSRAFFLSGGIPRWNGSLFFPATIPDLIGIKDRKYIDHTGTHLHRGVGDLMRYAALVSFAESADFGPHHLLRPDSKRVQARLPDEALYALALYIDSLQPPPNPNRFDESAAAGQKIFQREGCMNCHTPPLYTSNKLTLAAGFIPPQDAPATLDVLRLSIGTDPGLALKTRKGTGYYKVPSLKGIWYRGHYLHDGSVGSLEEMFDPERVRDTHKPGGFIPVGETTHAISGHEFGLRLNPGEREQLIAFLRTL